MNNIYFDEVFYRDVFIRAIYHIYKRGGFV